MAAASELRSVIVVSESSLFASDRVVSHFSLRDDDTKPRTHSASN